MKETPTLSVVIAAFNEESNIEELTLRIDKALKTYKIPYELIYVIAGTDNTIKIAYELQKKLPITIFYTPQPGGLGYDFKKGFAAVSPSAQYVLTMDADLNHHPEEIPLFLKKIKEKNADIVVGSRVIEGGITENIPGWKRFVSKIANTVFKLITNIPVQDKTSGYRLYKNKVIQQIAPEIHSKNFEFLMEILIIAAKKKYVITEIPITFTYRIHGKSKMNFIKTAMGYAKLLMKHLF